MSEKTTGTQTAPQSTSLKLVEPQRLADRTKRLHEAIAARAFEIFECEGGLSGRELEHWYKAEAELLHPLHVHVLESSEAVEVQAEVPGFSLKELAISVQPQQIVICGKKQSSDERKQGMTIYREYCSNEIHRVIDLPADVEATLVAATLKDGILALSFPKRSQGTNVLTSQRR